MPFQLFLNGKYREEEKCNMQAMKELETERDNLARKCAILAESQRNMKSELDSKNKCIAELQGQAILLATEVKKISHDCAMQVGSMHDRCAHMEIQLQTALSKHDGSAKHKGLQVPKDQQSASRSFCETTMDESEHNVAALEKRNSELQSVSSQVSTCSLFPAATFPLQYCAYKPSLSRVCLMRTHINLQALAAIQRISAGLLPEYDRLKQQLAESQTYGQQVSARLLLMEEQQESLMETHRAIQEAFQQVNNEHDERGLASDVVD